MDRRGWKEFLTTYARELTQRDPSRIGLREHPDDYFSSPATAEQIAAVEARLSLRLSPSLCSFYEVTNGWPSMGRTIYGIRPVERLDSMERAEPDLFDVLRDDAPVGAARRAAGTYEYEHTTRVVRSVVLSLGGDSAYLVLDPDRPDAQGEWPAGIWASWYPGIRWEAPDFASLVQLLRTRTLRGVPIE
jgi:hypothetical protein